MTDTKHSAGAVRAGKLRYTPETNDITGEFSVYDNGEIWWTVNSERDAIELCERLNRDIANLKRAKEVNAVLVEGLQNFTQIGNHQWSQLAVRTLKKAKAPPTKKEILMGDIKLIEPQIVFDCEFAGIHRDNSNGYISFSVLFKPKELEEALNSEERLTFWELEQGQPIRISMQRIEE